MGFSTSLSPSPVSIFLDRRYRTDYSKDQSYLLRGQIRGMGGIVTWMMWAPYQPDNNGKIRFSLAIYSGPLGNNAFLPNQNPSVNNLRSF